MIYSIFHVLHQRLEPSVVKTQRNVHILKQAVGASGKTSQRSLLICLWKDDNSFFRVRSWGKGNPFNEAFHCLLQMKERWASLSDIRKQGLFEKLRAIKYYWNIRHVRQMELARYSTNWYLLSTYYGQKTKLEIMLCILLYIIHPITLTKWLLFSKDVSRK